MSQPSRTFQSDDPEFTRRMERIKNNFDRLDTELNELEEVLLDENYLQGLAASQSDVIRKPR